MLPRIEVATVNSTFTLTTKNENHCYPGNVATTNSGKVNKRHIDHVAAVANGQHFVPESAVLRHDCHHVMLQSRILQSQHIVN